MNVATHYLKTFGETTDDYVGCCGELANVLCQKDDHILYVEGDAVFVYGWRYHMALLRDGLVHDAWCEGDALPVKEWLIKMFGPDLGVEVSLDGDTIFTGRCKDFEGAMRETDSKASCLP